MKDANIGGQWTRLLFLYVCIVHSTILHLHCCMLIAGTTASLVHVLHVLNVIYMLHYEYYCILLTCPLSCVNSNITAAVTTFSFLFFFLHFQDYYKWDSTAAKQKSWDTCSTFYRPFALPDNQLSRSPFYYVFQISQNM